MRGNRQPQEKRQKRPEALPIRTPYKYNIFVRAGLRAKSNQGLFQAIYLKVAIIYETFITDQIHTLYILWIMSIYETYLSIRKILFLFIDEENKSQRG